MTKTTAEQLRAFVATALVAATIVGTDQRSSRADGPKGDSAAEPAARTQQDADSRTMTVQVVDAVGQPLSGARVFASIWELPGAKDYPNRDYNTDENGRANIAIPQRLQILRLWCSKERHVPLSVNFARGTHEEGRLIPNEYEFRLQQGHRLSGRVVDADGDPIANARVEVMVDVDDPVRGVNPDPTIDTWLATEDDAPVTDENGRWEITNAPPPSEKGRMDYDFRLKVTHPDFAGDTRWGELQQQQGVTNEDLRRGTATLTLDRGIVVSGKITGPDGKTVNRGLVIWSHDPYSAQRVNKIPIDNQGHYETKRLAPGKLSFTVVAPGFAPTRQIVQVNHASNKVDFQLKPGSRLQIRVVDQSGKPVSNAYVAVRQWRGTEVLYTYQHAKIASPGIPRRATDDGVYEWDWAPEDAVTYSVRAEGFSSKEVSLVAKSKPHVVTLAPRRMVAGKVTDAATGKPVDQFVAMPVIVFRPDFYHTRTTDAKVGRNGRYELPLVGSADPEDRYRVRFEAEGYRSTISEESFGPLDGRATLNVRLEPAPPRQGQVVDANGQPVENATVLEASPTDVPRTANGKPEAYGSRPVHTDARGHFQMHATTEPVLVRVYDDLGFVEKAVAPHEKAIGQLTLEPWATLSGRLTQAGSPISGQSIRFYPLVDRELIQPRFQDSYYATTDADGRFRFDRLPSIKGSLTATLGPWEESSLTSSEAIPLELSPGEHREVTLGGQGATISGRVVATGRGNEDFSKQWSINYLVSRNPGVDYPKKATPLSFDPAGPLQPEWLRQADFRSWLATRLNYFVKLSDDGRLQIHGVPPGAYDLAIQLYEEPAGCLVETVGEKVVPITVTAEQAVSGSVEIGNIEVKCRIGPRVGSDMRVFRFTDTSGRVRRVDDMHGRYVLLHVWATWCAPCLRSMPMLEASVERYSDAPLTVVGLNVDEDASTAMAMAERQEWDWAQNYLGSESDLMRQLAVSSVPAYYLIGPQGKLLGSANQWQQIERLLSGELRAALIRGTVADEAGMPVAGASIQINRYEGTRIDAEHLATKTDSEGRFEFHLPVERGGQLIIKEVWAEHPGFLRITVTGRYALVPSQEQTFDFVMRPGEILAGKVNKPLTPIERRTGVKPEQEQYVLRISGSEFQQMQMTEKGGAFEVYVPKGEYSIEVVGTSIRSDAIASGTKNLVLMPEDVVISNEVLATAFDALWKDMDVHYSYFAYKPDVDWSQLGKTYREQAIAAKSLEQFLQTLKEMLSELEDMHIWIETDSQVIGTHQTPWQPNWNPRVLKAALREPTKCGNFAIVGTTIPDGFGCLLINQQSAATREAVQQTVVAIQKLHDVPGFIVDLRGGCSGGDERFAQQVAQAFCDRRVVYAKHKFRNGAAHNAFGEESERVLQPSERPFTKPVVCLIGKKCMSSGEAFVLMMKALPQVVTIGGPTRGASGNPAKFALPGLNVNVWYSRWVSLLPNGEVFEGRGVKPDVEVARPPSAYQGNNDPTWEEGLKVLHHSTAPRQ